jgi:hypothetical protein
MTDSGSFDPGDLVYGADLNALNSLCNAKCAQAGVAGSGVGSVTSADTVAAAHVNAVVAAYQRCWDASSNKPGTRQASVAGGGLISGALFQNMWTQLNQMTFTQAWADWGEASESALATADIFVCLMKTAVQNAHEIGQGGGLSEANRTLTYYQGGYGVGAVEAAAGTPPYRHCNGSGFQVTNDLLNALICEQSEFSILVKVSGALDWTGSGYHDGRVFVFYGAGVSLDFRGTHSPYNRVMLDTSGSGQFELYAGSPTGTWWAGVFYKGGVLYMGMTQTRPTKWSDFAGANRATWTRGQYPANAFSAYDKNLMTSIWGASRTCLKGNLHYVIIAKTCLIDVAA